MCIGIPMRVLESDGVMALCEGRGERRRLNMLMVGECPPGSWVMSFLGSARAILTEEDALSINQALDGLEAVMQRGIESTDTSPNQRKGDNLKASQYRHDGR